MPEGDTIHSAARRVGAALVGEQIVSIETPQARHAKDRWPERLGEQPVTSVDARGKHLFIRFAGGLTLHSHLRMGGSWGVYPRGRRWHRSPRRAWLVVRTARAEVVQFDGPVLELLTDSRTRFDQRLAALGPDILAEDWDEDDYLRRLRADDPTRGIGDALLDQRILAGIGNVWKSEGCWDAGVDPWRRVEEVTDYEARLIAGRVRPRMQESAAGDGKPRGVRVYGRAGRGQPHHLLVSRVPVMKRVGHKGADLIAPGNTIASFEAALEHGVDMIEFDVLPLGGGGLVLAHDDEDAASREVLTLEEGLDALAGEAYRGIELDVDLKRPGYEGRVLDALRERGLTDRVLVSTQYLESLARLDGVRRGWSVPKVRRDYTRTAAAPVAYAIARVMRRRLPGQVAVALREGRCEAVMAHWILASERLVEAAHAGGGEVYIWTVDKRETIERLDRMGVDGVITNDPRLFGAPAA